MDRYVPPDKRLDADGMRRAGIALRELTRAGVLAYVRGEEVHFAGSRDWEYTVSTLRDPQLTSAHVDAILKHGAALQPLADAVRIVAREADDFGYEFRLHDYYPDEGWKNAVGTIIIELEDRRAHIAPRWFAWVRSPAAAIHPQTTHATGSSPLPAVPKVRGLEDEP